MNETLINIQEVSYYYKSHNEEVQDVKALSNLSLDIKSGEFVVVIGRNGSGKSTLARLINALLIPSEGVVFVKGMKTADEEYLWDIRSSAGMVFQNPDNQIIGTIVEEDVAFGPENLGVSSEEIRKRVDEALKMVNMFEHRKHAPHLLSGGQKQRVAIAGVLAMKPQCIILDEATSMLDPVGRSEVMRVLKKMNKDEGITVVHITHHMDEASMANRVIVIDEGEIILDGSAKEVFSDVDRVKNVGLDVPQVTELFHLLKKDGVDLPDSILNVDEAFGALSDIFKNR